MTNMDFSEKQMAEVIIAHSQELLGEQLSLIERNLWIGRYELDLLFGDRHGAKLIVELQRGSLDRYHLYKVLDYYDEYKARHPEEFVEVMVVANLISPERKERLGKRGINFREIPDETIRRYLARDSSLPSTTPPQTSTPRDRAAKESEELMHNAPQWFRDHLPTLQPSVSQQIRNLPAIFQHFHDPDTWAITGAVGTYWQDRLNLAPQQDLYNLFHAVQFAIGHLYASLLGRQVGLPYDRLRLAASACAPDLIPFLALGYEETLPLKFLYAREKIVNDLSGKCRENPSFLVTLCSSHRSFWAQYPEGLANSESQLFLELLGVCLADIAREVAHSHFGNTAIPIGVDGNNQFITRPLVSDAAKRGDFYHHLSVVLALPTTISARLWTSEEALSQTHVNHAFPSVEHAYEVGTEMLINAYGSRVYTIDQISEVMIQAGETKSIILLETPNHSFGYKVIYKDGTISLGQVKLTIEGDGKLTCDHYSTNTVLGFVTFSTNEEPTEQANQAAESGNEFALVAAIIRDFLVCEEKESFYSGRGQAKKTGKSKASLVIRYLPRFRVRYIGVRQLEYKAHRAEVVGHHVSGHLRQCRMASPAQLVLARQFGIFVPDGFTFVRPHDRGESARVLYRSKSALQMLYA
jgi:hypothetical protein